MRKLERIIILKFKVYPNYIHKSYLKIILKLKIRREYPLLIKEYSFKFNILKIGVEKAEEKGVEAIKYLKKQMLQHINNTVYQNPEDRIRDEQLAYRFYDLKNLKKEMNYYKNKLIGVQNWLESLKEEHISAEREINQHKTKIERLK